MGLNGRIYEFAASAGAFEGYVYPKEKLDVGYLPDWVENLLVAYHSLPQEAVRDFQDSLDGTLGRAVQALIPVLGEDHEVIRKLKSMIVGDLPGSANDFEKKKWFDLHFAC